MVQPITQGETYKDTATALDVAALYERISQPNDLFILDVRNDEEFAAWRIEARYTPDTMHIFYGEFVEEEQSATMKIPADKEIIVVCAKGGASDYVAEILRENYGLNAKNLEGGMIAWGNYYAIRSAFQGDAYQIYQVERVARGCLSYILISQGQAAVIDPTRHIDQYLDFLANQDAHLSLILDTHAHADHISGGALLAANSTAPYFLHPYDAIHPFDMLPAQISYQPLNDGQVFELGELSIQVIHTPGHTLGQVNFLVRDRKSDSFVFTGDNLFLESFGRPDLGGQGQTWALLVYRTIFEKFRTLIPAEAWLFPGHYAVHQEANEAGVFTRPVAEVWKENSALQITEEEAFVRYTLDHLLPIPSQYVQIKRVNTGLVNATEQEASELELGKNVCALSEAYER
jgi:glyoxylase-like metal-dependent hydrolase (beta-lactamase superfamily II)/rhodanese-related sulfurtransferase